MNLKMIKKHLPQFEVDGERNIWIVKPGAMSRGRGIICYDKLEDMLKLVDNPITRTDGKWVVQKYIENPLLIHNTKFDIRQWFLITDWNPLTVWFYKSSYLRFSSQEFTLNDFSESIHLCNNAIQANYQNGPRSKLLPSCNMWDNAQFIEHLKTFGQQHQWETLIYPSMKESILCALLSCQDVVKYRKNSFELFGADFMLTPDFKPWLLEINCSPAMSSSTDVTARLCSQVLTDTLKVILDYPTNKRCDTGDFELIYRQDYIIVPQYTGLELSIKGRSVNRPRTGKNRSGAEVLSDSSDEDDVSLNVKRCSTQPIVNCKYTANSFSVTHDELSKTINKKIKERARLEDVELLSHHSSLSSIDYKSVLIERPLSEFQLRTKSRSNKLRKLTIGANFVHCNEQVCKKSSLSEKLDENKMQNQDNSLPMKSVAENQNNVINQSVDATSIHLAENKVIDNSRRNSKSTIAEAAPPVPKVLNIKEILQKPRFLGYQNITHGNSSFVSSKNSSSVSSSKKIKKKKKKRRNVSFGRSTKSKLSSKRNSIDSQGSDNNSDSHATTSSNGSTKTESRLTTESVRQQPSIVRATKAAPTNNSQSFAKPRFIDRLRENVSIVKCRKNTQQGSTLEDSIAGTKLSKTPLVGPVWKTHSSLEMHNIHSDDIKLDNLLRDNAPIGTAPKIKLHKKAKKKKVPTATLR